MRHLKTKIERIKFLLKRRNIIYIETMVVEERVYGFITEFNWSKSKMVQRASDASAFVKRFWRGLFHGSPIHGKKYLCVLLRRQEGDLFNDSTRSFLNNKSVPRSFRVERINHRFDDPLKTLWKKDNKKGSYYSEGETKSRRETEENC